MIITFIGMKDLEMESKIKHSIGRYVYSGISSDIEKAETDEEIEILENLVKHYKENYMVSGYYLEQELEQKKLELNKESVENG